MATYDVYVFCDGTGGNVELRNSTYSSTTNAPGSSSNPISCSQGDSIRFNFNLQNSATSGTVNVNYAGTASSYWTYTSSITVNTNSSATYQLKSNATTGSGARARVESSGDTALVYLNISSSGVTAPTISGTSFTYYNNETRALYYTGSTWFVRTTINLSNNGSGGTLEYGRNTSSDSVSGASWQTDGQTYSFSNYTTPVTNNANTWNHALGGTRYFYASQDRDTAGAFDSTGGVTYNYVTPNTVTVSNGTVAYNATSYDFTLTNCTTDYGGYLNRGAEVYSVSTTDHGSGEISAATVSGSRFTSAASTGSSTIVKTVDNANLPANTAGATETYYVYAYRRNDWSGKQVYIKTDSFTLTRAAPPPSYSVTAPASINEGSSGTINISTTNVSNGTVLYWSVSTGDTPVDFDSPASGSVTISNNAASFSVTPTADLTTEGAETATVNIRTGSQAGSIVATDTFTINDTSITPSGSISFTGASFATEGSGNLGFSFSNTVDGTYYYDVNRISGSTGSGEIQNPGPSSFTVSGGTGTVSLIFYNDSVSEIGFQGETFVMRYGTTSNSEDLDTLNFTLYDDDSGISYSDSTINVSSSATSHNVSIVRAAGDSSSAVTARIRNVTTNTVIGSTFSLSTGTTVRTVSDVPSAGSTETFRVEVYNGNAYINGPNYTVQTALDTTPENYTNLAGNVSNASLSTYHYATFSTAAAGTTSPGTGFNVGTTISNGTDISVSNGEYSLNAGSNWLTGNATINQTQVVYFRGQSSSSFNTAVTHSLTIGSETRSFTTTTVGQDTTPESFVDFTSVTNQAKNTVITSNSQTITTITGNVNVSVSGAGSPEVSINGGTFTSSPGTISNNQTIRVRLTSASTDNTTRTATVTIGTVSKDFDVTTSGSGGSGSDTGSGGTSNYGIEIYAPNGTTKVLSPGTRYINLMNDPEEVDVPANGSVVVQQDMTGLTTSNSDVIFTGAFTDEHLSLSVSRESNGFRLSNSTANIISVTPMIIRY